MRRGPVFITSRDPLPPADWADRDGLVAVGGGLSVPRLLEAYQKGLFPWYEAGWPVLWWSPDPRGILELHEFHVPKRLRRTMRTKPFQVTFDQDFRAVMEGCATAHGRGSWITDEMIEAYTEFHKAGYAHSVEVWRDGQLVGGLYGVGIGGFFAGESMFHRVSDASNVALVRLVEHLRARGFQLFDIQTLNPHTIRFGARAIPRREYLARLAAAIRLPVTFSPTPGQTVAGNST
jgi:leucyl/phenylalanyl-tRNA--protein transferase